MWAGRAPGAAFMLCLWSSGVPEPIKSNQGCGGLAQKTKMKLMSECLLPVSSSKYVPLVCLCRVKAGPRTLTGMPMCV